MMTFQIENSNEARVGNRSRAAREEEGLAKRPEALLVTPYREDIAIVKRIFQQQQWKLHTLDNLNSASDLLRKNPVSVVITERDQSVGDWRDLLEQTQDSSTPPLVVVISRFADEHLWTEVLNRGGHDVIAKPLREFDVLWVLRHAFGIRSPAVKAAGHSYSYEAKRTPCL